MNEPVLIYKKKNLEETTREICERLDISANVLIHSFVGFHCQLIALHKGRKQRQWNGNGYIEGVLTVPLLNPPLRTP